MRRDKRGAEVEREREGEREGMLEGKLNCFRYRSFLESQ